ncbi:MAG: PD-(D/E)XK nuclease family protein [Saprospiraceae bacterium]
MKAFSISSYRTFQKCQWQWYFTAKAKCGNVKHDLKRREITMLSQLQTLSAWRGQLVDDVLSRYVIDVFNKKQNIMLSAALGKARMLFEERLTFSKNLEYRHQDNKKSHLLDKFSPLIDHEYGILIDDERLDKAWEDIELSLTNLFQNEPFIQMLRSSDFLAAQQTLYFTIENYNVVGTPDLIVYTKNQPPHIIDWKVHIEPTKHYNEQLLLYALAVNHTIQQRWNLEAWEKFPIVEYQLTEYQLLKNELRHYEITDDYLDQIREFIVEGAYRLQLTGADLDYNFDDLNDLDMTENPENCLTCSFRKICNHVPESTKRNYTLFD